MEDKDEQAQGKVQALPRGEGGLGKQESYQLFPYLWDTAHGLKDTAHHGEEDIAPGASQEVRACCWQ